MQISRLRPSRFLAFIKDALRFLRDSPCLAGLAVFAGILVVGWWFCLQRAVHVQIRLDALPPSGVQVYYRESGQTFSESRCIPVRVDGRTPAIADIQVPTRCLRSLRIDFGVAPGEFAILGGRVGPIPFPPWRKWCFSPDLMVKGDADESGGLKLFSDRTDPHMIVKFHRPIQPAPGTRALNRERLTILLSLALVAALATGTVLSQRSRTEIRRPSEHGEADFSWICLSFVMAFFFFVGVRTASCGGDMGDHIAVADGIDIKGLLHPLGFWRQHYYPMWHLLVRLVKGVLHLKSTTFAAGLANGICYNACLIGVYAFLRRTFRKVDPCALIGMALAVCTVGCMLGPWVDVDHLYENTHNAWWNPTNSMVLALALPCVLLTARLWDGLSSRWTFRACASPDGGIPGCRDRVPWPQIMALGLLLVLTELAKPSFIQVYLPAMFLFFAGWLLANRRSFVPSLILSQALIAPCLVLMSQYLLAFDTGDGGGGIGFGFMKVAGQYRHAGLNQFYAIAFPVAALIVAIRRRSVHTEDVLCWLMLLAGMFMKWFLFERGLRMAHGNLGWGSKVAMYLVWATGIRQYVDYAIAQNGLRGRLGFWALSILLLLHVVMGFYMMYRWLVLVL